MVPLSFDTKAERTAYYKSKLSTDAKWALKALRVIGSFQTQEEQTVERTVEYNGVGFTGFDGGILTSYLAQVQRWDGSPISQARYSCPLSARQMVTLHKLITKYADQLIRIGDSTGRAIPVVHRKRVMTA